MIERVIPAPEQAWGFTCCGVASGFDTERERDRAALNHLGRHTIDLWQWKVDE